MARWRLIHIFSILAIFCDFLALKCSKIPISLSKLILILTGWQNCSFIFGAKIQIILNWFYVISDSQTDKDNYQCSKNLRITTYIILWLGIRNLFFGSVNLKLSHSLKWSKVIEKCYISCTRSLKNRRLASCSSSAVL